MCTHTKNGTMAWKIFLLKKYLKNISLEEGKYYFFFILEKPEKSMQKKMNGEIFVMNGFTLFQQI